MDIEATIKNYIIEELLTGKKRQVRPDESLIESGVLNSLTLLQLIAFIEEQFGIRIEDSEMDPANFQSIERMKTFIKAKR